MTSVGYFDAALYRRDDLRDIPPSLLLSAAGVVLLGVVALTARWVIRHPDRLRPPSSAALILMVAFGAVALLVGTLTEITENVVEGDELVRVDSPVSSYLVEHREPWLTTTMGVITHLGSTTVLVPTLLAVGFVARRRSHTWAPMVFLTVTLGGATLTSTVIKLVIARSRPSSEALVHALGYAFPSGHSTAATAGWLAVAVVLAWLARSVTVRVSLLAAALVIAVLVGVSRVYLGVHAFTDVLAGWALGALWLVAALTVTHLLTFRRR